MANLFFSEILGGGLVTIGSFIPPIFFIYISLSILEDSGYMARAAFIADKFMRKTGFQVRHLFFDCRFWLHSSGNYGQLGLWKNQETGFCINFNSIYFLWGKATCLYILVMLFFPQRADIVYFCSLFFGYNNGDFNRFIIKGYYF